MARSVGQVFVASEAVAFADISPATSGRASTLFKVGRRLGGAVGVAAATTVIVLVGAPTGGLIAPSAYHAALFVAAAVNLLGLLPAPAVREGDAANTIPQPRPTKKGRHQNVVLEPSLRDRGRGTEHGT